MTGDLRQRGETLIEVLVAIAIIAVAFVVIVGGIGTAIVGSDVQQNQTAADAALKSAAETIKGDAYQPCAGPGDPAYSAGLATGVTVSGVAFWDGSSNFVRTCTSGHDPGLQLITVTMTPSTVHPVHAPGMTSLEVVKRAP